MSLQVIPADLTPAELSELAALGRRFLFGGLSAEDNVRRIALGSCDSMSAAGRRRELAYVNAVIDR
jgi:hypothetical protein